MISIAAQMKLKFERCQVYKLNISACLTKQEQDYYNLYCDGISSKALKERLGIEFPTLDTISKGFHISFEEAENLLNCQFGKKQFKPFLCNEIKKFPENEIREIRKEAIYFLDEKGNLTDNVKNDKKIVWFENECVRRCNTDLSDIPLLNEFLLLKCGSEALTDVLKQIIDRGVILEGRHYIFYTSSTGQMKDSEITLVEENYWEKNKYALMCGLTEERINAKGGINMGKFFAAKALNISNSVLYDSGVSIDDVIIVPDFETMVTGMVNYLDVETLEIQKKKMDIFIQHMDGAGIFIPGTFPCSCQIRGGWIKGAVFPFDFHKFIEKYKDKLYNTNMIDAWGNPIAVDEFMNAKIILTDSQLKMRKYYESMQEYRDCFKKSQLSITINNCSHVPGTEVKVAYQPFQTIPRENITDKAIEKLTSKTIGYINNAKTDSKVALKFMGIDLESSEEEEKAEMSALYASIIRYPAMLNDVHVQKMMKSAVQSFRKDAMGSKLIMDGFWSYICPDLYAFCEWLFLGEDTPEGLVPEGYIYNNYYDDINIEETCCLRYPHLSDCEHGVRQVLQSEECKEWFIGTDTIVSSHDLISKVLQADWDGDHICLVHDKAFLDVLDRDKYPLYYNMTKAEAAPITNDAIMLCLTSSFQNENIGYVSNAITKIFNSIDEPDIKLVRVLCAYNNFVIDYFKTQKSMDLKEYTSLYEDYKDSEQYKCPHFFKYAKDKKQKQCERINENGNVDRISKYVSVKTSSGITKIKYPSNDLFDPQMLMDEKEYEVKRNSVEYEKLNLLLSELKRENIKIYKKVKEDLNKKESDKQIFTIYCISRFKKIIKERKKIANYLLDIEYFNEEHKMESKDILWNCYGDILYDNLCKNIKADKELSIKRNAYKSSEEREKEITKSREKIKKEQEEIIEIPITQAIYDYIMGIQTRKRCEKDRYILYVIYVSIERFKKKYGADQNYIRLYKGTRQKNKTTAATIDTWISSKCTQKGLDRLQKDGYIKQEELKKYKKVYLCDFSNRIGAEEGEKNLFSASSYNPLLELWEYNGDRKVEKCKICEKKFVVIGNAKTCSDKCSNILRKRNKNIKSKQ